MRSQRSFSTLPLVAGVLTAVAATTCLTPTATAHYHPKQGRWLQRDPSGYADGMNLYEYVRSRPAIAGDPYGLYASDVHEERTRVWATSEGMSGKAARLVGVENNATDGGWNAGGGLGPSPVSGDQSRHFDRNNASSINQDSRSVWMIRESDNAEEACSKNRDEPKTAAQHLGRALHSLQDWWGHGDYSKGRSNTYTHHGSPPTSHYDSWNWDAATTSDGRPPQVFDSNTGKEIPYTNWITGKKRNHGVRQNTKYAVRRFLEFVKSSKAGCDCRDFFLR